MTVSASGTASCAIQYDEKPAASAFAAWSTIWSIGAPKAMSDEPLMPMRMRASCTGKAPHRSLLAVRHVGVGALPLHEVGQQRAQLRLVEVVKERVDERSASPTEHGADHRVGL